MSSECCGMHVVRCAKILSIIGMVLSILGGNILGFIVFFAVYYGIKHNKSTWLFPAVILLAIDTFIVVLCIIGLGVGLASVIYQKSAEGIVIMAVFLVLTGISLFFNVFALIVINNARKYIFASKRNYPPPTAPTTYPQATTAATTTTVTHQNYDNSSATSYPAQTSYPTYPTKNNYYNA